MKSVDVMKCEKCGAVALVIHDEHALCVECFMARMAQSREQVKMMSEVRPLCYTQVLAETTSKPVQFCR
jgi:hypothetical protein